MIVENTDLENLMDHEELKKKLKEFNNTESLKLFCHLINENCKLLSNIAKRKTDAMIIVSMFR